MPATQESQVIWVTSYPESYTLPSLPHQASSPHLAQGLHHRFTQKTNPSLPEHFRAISILPFLSKVLEPCVHAQLSQFVYKQNLLSPFNLGLDPFTASLSDWRY